MSNDMNEILNEKLQLLIDEFQKLNAGKLDSYGDSVAAIGVKMDAINESVKRVNIPKEVTLRHEHVHDHRYVNVWIKRMAWALAAVVVIAVSFCAYYKYTYDVNEENRRINASQKQTYDWLYNYFLYMRDGGAPKTTATYLKEHHPPQ
jgi:hypothetical protein